MDAARANHADFAEMQFEALFEFVVERLVRQRGDALGLRSRFCPYDRRSAAFERQDGKRPSGQKVFLSAALVVAFVGSPGIRARQA